MEAMAQKGLIAADGKKQPLYFALQLYNEMPLERRPVSGENANIQSLSSSDANKAMIVATNISDAAQDVTFSLSNLLFATGTVELIKIDNTHSNNGTLSVENLGNLSGTSFTTSVNIPANGVACVRVVKNTSINNLKYNPFGQYINDKRMWWFSFSEGWCWNAFDPKTMTAYLGDTITRDWGTSQVGIYVDSLPMNFNIKWEAQGTTKEMDDNSAVYVRIDFEDYFEGEKYWANSVVFTDLTHFTGSFSANHGSMPAFGSGQKEKVVIDADFINGFNVDVASLYSDEWTGEDWTGNAVITFYIQNPGTGATGFIAKAKLTDLNATALPRNAASLGESAILYPNPFRNTLNIKTGTNKPYTISIFDITGKELLKKQIPAGNNVQSIATGNLPEGVYVVKTETAGNVNVQKVVKK